MEGFLAQINYDNPPALDVIEEAKCPTGCLATREEHYEAKRATLQENAV